MFTDCSNLQQACRLFSIDHLDKTSLEQITKEYKNLAIKYHPDKYSEAVGKELCTQAFQNVNAAYEVLRKRLESYNCCAQKKEYDPSPSCCQEEGGENDEVKNPRKRKRSNSPSSDSPRTRSEYPSRENTGPGFLYHVNKWYSKDWHAKFYIPDYLKFSSKTLREIKSKPDSLKTSSKNLSDKISKIVFSNEYKNFLFISLPTKRAKGFASRIQTALCDIIPAHWGTYDDQEAITLKIPIERKHLCSKVWAVIFKAYNFPLKVQNFTKVLLNTKEFHLHLF